MFDELEAASVAASAPTLFRTLSVTCILVQTKFMALVEITAVHDLQLVAFFIQSNIFVVVGGWFVAAAEETLDGLIVVVGTVVADQWLQFHPQRLRDHPKVTLPLHVKPGHLKDPLDLNLFLQHVRKDSQVAIPHETVRQEIDSKMLDCDGTTKILDGLSESFQLDQAHPVMIAASEYEVNGANRSRGRTNFSTVMESELLGEMTKTCAKLGDRESIIAVHDFATVVVEIMAFRMSAHVRCVHMSDLLDAHQVCSYSLMWSGKGSTW